MALIGSLTGLAAAEEFSNVPVRGMVTMLDLGADKCVPCKMMAPIIAKIEKTYEGKAAIVFIDVWKHKEQAGRFTGIGTLAKSDEGIAADMVDTATSLIEHKRQPQHIFVEVS